MWNPSFGEMSRERDLVLHKSVKQWWMLACWTWTCLPVRLLVRNGRKDCGERDEIGVEEEDKTAGNINEHYIWLLSEVVSPKVFNGFGCSTLNQPHCSARIALPTTPATMLWTCSIPAPQIHINILTLTWSKEMEASGKQHWRPYWRL